MTWSNILAVFIGSGLGGVCRYLCSRGIQSLAPHTAFPWGTFAVNLIGCFIIGLLYGLLNKSNLLNPELRLLLTVGFCGGFTTFSTFINESYMLSGSNLLLSMGYLLASIAGGFLMLYLAYKLVA